LHAQSLTRVIMNLKAFLNLTFYTSELDQFLKKFDITHPNLSLSQNLEKAKHERIYALRDYATNIHSSDDIWDALK
jgi:hypothetical protein